MRQIVLENDVLKVKLSPSLGGKITSFFLKEKKFELAAQGKEMQHQVKDSFAPFAYGMDDTFPNINEEAIEWKGRKLYYPDHGEIWKAEFKISEHIQSSVSLTWHSTAFQYLFEKTMCLEKNILKVQYHIVNEGDDELPCIWTWHGLIRYEQDMEFLLPEGVNHYRNVLSGCILGEEGKVYPAQNGVYDFARMPNPDCCNMVKYYGVESGITGHCGVYYPSDDVSYYLDYDAQKLPYFGVWITAGGFQGDYNCALEPSNGYYDSISKANKNQKLPVLKKGEILDFMFELSLKEGK